MPNLKFNPMEYVTLGAVAGVVSYFHVLANHDL